MLDKPEPIDRYTRQLANTHQQLYGGDARVSARVPFATTAYYQFALVMNLFCGPLQSACDFLYQSLIVVKLLEATVAPSISRGSYACLPLTIKDKHFTLYTAGLTTGSQRKPSGLAPHGNRGHLTRQPWYDPMRPNTFTSRIVRVL